MPVGKPGACGNGAGSNARSASRFVAALSSPDTKVSRLGAGAGKRRGEPIEGREPGETGTGEWVWIDPKKHRNYADKTGIRQQPIGDGLNPQQSTPVFYSAISN
jgi:hypothetical protein